LTNFFNLGLKQVQIFFSRKTPVLAPLRLKINKPQKFVHTRSRNRINDGSLLHFVRQLATRPVFDWPTTITRIFASGRNNLYDLLGRKLARRTTAMRIAKHIHDRTFKDSPWFVHFDRQQGIDRVLPSLPPATDTMPPKINELADLDILQLLGCQQNDASP
jgi:hypothetical protein